MGSITTHQGIAAIDFDDEMQGYIDVTIGYEQLCGPDLPEAVLPYERAAERASKENLDDKLRLSESLQRRKCAGCSSERGMQTRKDETMAMLMLRIPVFTILLLTGCDNGQVKEGPAAQIQQIESPLQNTVEGMAKTKALDLERGRLTARGF